MGRQTQSKPQFAPAPESREVPASNYYLRKEMQKAGLEISSVQPGSREKLRNKTPDQSAYYKGKRPLPAAAPESMSRQVQNARAVDYKYARLLEKDPTWASSFNPRRIKATCNLQLPNLVEKIYKVKQANQEERERLHEEREQAF